MKYKIICNDPKYVDKNYKGLDFVAVAYTDDDTLANRYMSNSMTTGGKPLFEVEEIEEQA